MNLQHDYHRLLEMLRQKLVVSGWNISEEWSELDWWAKAVWKIQSTWKPIGVNFWLTFLTDPQDMTSCWGVGTSKAQPEDRREAEGQPILTLKNAELDVFVVSLNELRNNTQTSESGGPVDPPYEMKHG